MHGHRKEFQTHTGQAAARGVVKPGRQQRAGGWRRRTGVIVSPLQQHPVDPQRRPVQGLADHSEPAGDEPDQSVLPGLLAVRRPSAGRPQGQRPEGAQGAEETSQPPASRGRGRGRGAAGSRDMRTLTLCLKHLQHNLPPSFPNPVKTGRDSMRVGT